VSAGTGSAGAGEVAAEAVDHLAEELGDLLFQVYFHAVLGAEEGWFTLADVARGVHDKWWPVIRTSSVMWWPTRRKRWRPIGRC